MRRLLASLTVLLLFTTLCLPVFAWNGTGHMVIAEIAYRRLNPRARAEVDRLIALTSDPKSPDFVTASCWADDLKGYDMNAYNAWHYMDIPFEEGAKCTEPLPEENVLWAMGQCLRTLRSDRAPDVEKGRMLRLLIHFVSDIHQPLHTTSRFTPRTPKGDKGGNDFPVKTDRARNLHAYWDGGVTLYTQMVARPLQEDGRTLVKRLADEIMMACPPESLANAKETNFQVWAQEGHKLCREIVYADLKEGETPSETYNQRGTDCARKQSALGGYRLADILNRLYPEKTGSR